MAVRLTATGIPQTGLAEPRAEIHSPIASQARGSRSAGKAAISAAPIELVMPVSLTALELAVSAIAQEPAVSAIALEQEVLAIALALVVPGIALAAVLWVIAPAPAGIA